MEPGLINSAGLNHNKPKHETMNGILVTKLFSKDTLHVQCPADILEMDDGASAWLKHTVLYGTLVSRSECREKYKLMDVLNDSLALTFLKRVLDECGEPDECLFHL